MATCDEITQSTLLGHPRITTEKFKPPPDGACVNCRMPMSTFAGRVRPDVKSQAKPATAGSRPKGLKYIFFKFCSS